MRLLLGQNLDTHFQALFVALIWEFHAAVNTRKAMVALGHYYMVACLSIMEKLRSWNYIGYTPIREPTVFTVSHRFVAECVERLGRVFVSYCEDICESKPATAYSLTSYSLKHGIGIWFPSVFLCQFNAAIMLRWLSWTVAVSCWSLEFAILPSFNALIIQRQACVGKMFFFHTLGQHRVLMLDTLVEFVYLYESWRSLFNIEPESVMRDVYCTNTYALCRWDCGVTWLLHLHLNGDEILSLILEEIYNSSSLTNVCLSALREWSLFCCSSF